MVTDLQTYPADHALGIPIEDFRRNVQDGTLIDAVRKLQQIAEAFLANPDDATIRNRLSITSQNVYVRS